MTSTINRGSTTNIPGRSSSQVSIYDYPEHLNPFYEDDNHKRLRFWKINKSSQKEKKGRSNSFSLNGLKDIWAFKSFNLKKRSSTLGINKTSESPPMLRHQMVVHPTYDTYNTVDSRVRHTVQIGLNNNNNNNNNYNNNNNHHFPRGAGYRSSLQNVHSGGSDTASTSGDIGFYRNDRYRSTVQPASSGGSVGGYSTLATPTRRYIHNGGSVTPTPRSRFGVMSHGSSQSSINSTNPFDDDDDDNNNNDTDADTISRITTIDGVQVRRPGRKKRRAPPPPVRSSTPLGTANACISEDVSSITEQSQSKSLNQEEMAEISNLTAEIESFVRIADTDKEKLRDSPEKSKKKKEKSPPPPAPSSSIITTTSPTTTKTIINSEKLTRIERTSPPKQMNTVVTTVVLTERRRSSAEKQITNEQIQQLQHNAARHPEQSSKDMSPDRIREERSSSQRSRVSPENNDEYPERSSVTPEREPSIEVIGTSSTTTTTTSTATTTATTSTTTQIIPLQKNNSEKQLNIVKPKQNSPPKIFIRGATEDNDSIEMQPLPDTPTQTQSQPPPPPPSVITAKNYEKYHHEIVRTYETPKPQLIDELRITESTDDLVNDSQQNTSPPEESYKIRYVPLKNYTPEMERRSNSDFVSVPLRNGSNGTYKNEINQPNTNSSPILDENGKKVPPAPPQRRRSVRDIIASINKSQSLLKINQRKSSNNDSSSSTTKRYNDAIDQQITEHYSNIRKVEPISSASMPSTSNDENTTRRSTKEIIASEKELRDVITDMEKEQDFGYNNKNNENNNNRQHHHHHPEDVKHIPVMVERFDEFKQDELFKKCVVRREKSSFMDWNPLPKPRRSRNFDA